MEFTILVKTKKTEEKWWQPLEEIKIEGHSEYDVLSVAAYQVAGSLNPRINQADIRLSATVILRSKNISYRFEIIESKEENSKFNKLIVRNGYVDLFPNYKGEIEKKRFRVTVAKRLVKTKNWMDVAVHQVWSLGHWEVMGGVWSEYYSSKGVVEKRGQNDQGHYVGELRDKCGGEVYRFIVERQ